MFSRLEISMRLRPDLYAAGLLLVFACISIFSVQRQTLTYDERSHYRYGLQILNLNAERFDNSKMPLSALNAIPGKIAINLPEGKLREILGRVETGRYATIAVSLLIALLTYRWSKALYGPLAGLFSLFLYTWEPNILAHSQLVTTDIYAMGAVLLACYALWKFNQSPDWLHAGWLGVALGLSLLAKYTSVFLIPLFALLQAFRDAAGVIQVIRKRQYKALGIYAARALFFAGIIGLVALFIVNLGFLFYRSGTPLAGYNLKSDTLRSIRRTYPGLTNLPIPLPYPFLQGLDLVRYHERTGKTFGNIYLLGELRKDGFTGYYFVAALLKMPIATLIFILAALIHLLRHFNWRQWWLAEYTLLLPMLFFAIYFNFFNRSQIGFRYFLVVFPLLFVLSGRLLADWQGFSKPVRLTTVALGVYLVISVLSYYPHYIPYFNEIVYDRRFAYRYLADSNLDWGQAGWYGQNYLLQHPDSQVDPLQPASGRLIISPNSLVGITAEPETYRWLRENYAPVETIAYCYLVYQIPPDGLPGNLP